MTRDEIYAQIKEILSDSFELEPESITMESTLYEELDLDSIDAVDIFDSLQRFVTRNCQRT